MKIEELALKVAQSVEWNQAPHERDLIDFATRFLAAYTEQQEPVGKVVSWSPLHGTFVVQQVHTLNGFADPFTYGNVFAAPIVPADMVLVPREPTEAMIRASWDAAGRVRMTDGRYVLIPIAYGAMIAAGEVKL